MTPKQQRAMAQILRNQASKLDDDADRQEGVGAYARTNFGMKITSAKRKQLNGHFGQIKRQIKAAEKAGQTAKVKQLKAKLRAEEKKAGITSNQLSRGG